MPTYNAILLTWSFSFHDLSGDECCLLPKDLNVGYYPMVIDDNCSGSYSMSVHIWILSHLMVNTLWWISSMDVVILNTWILEGIYDMIEYALLGSALFDSVLRTLQKNVLVGDECLFMGIWWWWNLIRVKGMDVHSRPLGVSYYDFIYP